MAVIDVEDGHKDGQREGLDDNRIAIENANFSSNDGAASTVPKTPVRRPSAFGSDLPESSRQGQNPFGDSGNTDDAHSRKEQKEHDNKRGGDAAKLKNPHTTKRLSWASDAAVDGDRDPGRKKKVSHKVRKKHGDKRGGDAAKPKNPHDAQSSGAPDAALMGDQPRKRKKVKKAATSSSPHPPGNVASAVAALSGGIVASAAAASCGGGKPKTDTASGGGARKTGKKAAAALSSPHPPGDVATAAASSGGGKPKADPAPGGVARKKGKKAAAAASCSPHPPRNIVVARSRDGKRREDAAAAVTGASESGGIVASPGSGGSRGVADADSSVGRKEGSRAPALQAVRPVAMAMAQANLQSAILRT